MAKSVQKNTEVIELVAEEIPNIPISQQLEKAITTEVAKFDPFVKRLDELKVKYADFKINGIEDKEGYENARIAISELRTVRTGTAKDKSIIKAPFLSACGSIEEKSKWIIAEIEKLEQPIQDQKDKIDEEKDRIKAEKKAMQERAFVKRNMELSRLGATFDGTNFVLENVSYESVLVREADEDLWNEMILPKFTAIFNRNEAAKAEEKARKDKEAADMKAQQEELQRQQKQLQEQQEALRKQQQDADKKFREAAERDRIIKEKEIEKLWRKRLSELTDIGWNGQYCFDREDAEKHVLTYEELISLPEQEFNVVRDAFNAKIEQRKADRAKELMEKVEADKKAAIEKALEDQKEQQRLEAIQAERDRKAKEEADKLELEKAGDKEKYLKTIAYLNATPIHPMQSSQYRVKMKTLRDLLDQIKAL